MNRLVKCFFALSVMINIAYFTQETSSKLSFTKPSNPDLEFPIDEFNEDSSQITAKEGLIIEKKMKFDSGSYKKRIGSNNSEEFESPETIEIDEDEVAETRSLATEEEFIADGQENILDNKFDLKDALMKNSNFTEEDYAFYQDLDRQRSLEISAYISKLSEGSEVLTLEENENDEVLAINQKYKELLFEKIGEDSFKKYEDLVNQLNQQSVQESISGDQFYLLDF